MIQLDRKEYFRQLELEKKQKVEDMESSMYSFQPRINKKGLCDCCGKMKCSYKQQLFFDGIRDNEFQNHKEIKGFDETVTRMRKGLVDRYSKDILYRR